ncbi:MAG: lipopolysaccharide biosynthesis protein [Pseudomonadales bacterium]
MSESSSILNRIARNTGLLFSSKAIAGLAGLLYLALAGRTLGPEQLGMLILVHSTTIAIREIASFKSWQALIKYGAEYVSNQDNARLHSLLRLMVELDAIGSIAGSLLSALFFYYFAPLFGFPPDIASLAVLYCLSTLVALKASPVGVLRLFGRFVLLARNALVVPFLRTTGVVVCWAFDAPLGGFIVLWFLADVCSAVVLMWLGYQETRRQPLARNISWRWEPLSAEAHAKIWPFIWSANLHGTVGIATTHLPVLLSGALLGPGAAAFVKICQEVSGILGKPAQLLGETVYPEVSRLIPLNATQTIRSLLVRSVLLGGLASLILVVIVISGGQWLLVLLFGQEYRAASGLLTLLVIAAGIQLTTFIFEPLIYAQGRPDFVFVLRLVTSIAQISGMIVILPLLGVNGVGLTTILGTLFASLVMGFHAVGALGARQKI